MNTATTISIVRTMMHELIHAHILYLNYAEPGSDLIKSLNAFALAKGLVNDVMHAHHGFMPVYIDVIAESLYQWDQSNNPGNVQPMQFYQDMAWGGLTDFSENGINYIEYEGFKENFPDENERARIRDVISKEATNDSQAKGTPCN
ncbi:hypothetical protein MM239_15850 [Belliella sp. DSM 111904]|uniref:SprT-like family protein n=1 Tax=Belliella filtrata TaxID=2923435 RepID=A0ABS9V392_9BACT|nr:hypothetical protein [Belliella filtrata]MCH7410882.1 hypothetical protein [Belliella filtrata]